MFPGPHCYHPYKPSTPARIRIVDYVNPRRCFNLFNGVDFSTARSPDPSPLSSPVRNPHYPQDPPLNFFADHFLRNDLGNPLRPSTPSPDGPRNAAPDVGRTNKPAHEAPLPTAPRRKGKRGPKHLSFNHGAPRAPHRRAQEKRDAFRHKRVLDRHERRAMRACQGLTRLRREAEALMRPEQMNEGDKIFLEQLRALDLDQEQEHDLEQCRQRMSRAAGDLDQRKWEHEERDEAAAKMWGEDQDEEALEEQKKKVDAFMRAEDDKIEAHRRRVEEQAMRADERRLRAHDAMERKIREEQERLFRQELARKAKEEEERRRREEQERRIKEARERQLREDKERRQREERERQLRAEMERRQREERERMLREEIERLRKLAEAHERFMREHRERLAREEEEREARFSAEQAHRAAQEGQVHQLFVLYEGKWNELRTSNSMPPIDVREMPWPVLGIVSSADQITYENVRAFLFHPQRPGVEGKSKRDKLKTEMLRFHPDKFNARIVPKIQSSQRAVAQEIAGAVTRILTRIMTEDVEK